MIKINEITHNQFKLEKLINIYKPYFCKMAGNYTVNQQIKEDLLAEANVSLWQSNLNYDKDKGTTFYSFVATQAKYAMLNYLNQKGSTAATIFIPISQKEDYKLTTISMDIPIYDNKTISETIAEMEEDIDESKIVVLNAYMQTIKKKHRDIIEIKYLQGCSNSELAIMSGCSKQYIGEIVDKSIKHLQKQFGVPQHGIISKKHTKTSDKERELMEKHNVS